MHAVWQLKLKFYICSLLQFPGHEHLPWTCKFKITCSSKWYYSGVFFHAKHYQIQPTKKRVWHTIRLFHSDLSLMRGIVTTSKIQTFWWTRCTAWLGCRNRLWFAAAHDSPSYEAISEVTQHWWDCLLPFNILHMKVRGGNKSCRIIMGLSTVCIDLPSHIHTCVMFTWARFQMICQRKPFGNCLVQLLSSL